ncbi:MAG: DUF72 domain-containing protein [Caulobacteraceae bacterium]|nr:DUF72 domain-containing protein [Caulobacteraceae bacterium]
MKRGKAVGDLRIGTSGWSYAHWRGRFYPSGLPSKAWLACYAERFDTVELNGTFYRMPKEPAVAGWREGSPAGFLFAWKASRYITQAKRLKDAAEPLAYVLDRAGGLKEKLGPILFQLPPQMRRDDERLAEFLSLLPRTHRFTVEFRRPDWYVPEVMRLLADHSVALCVSDHHDAPAPAEATAPFVYLRLHGPGGRYCGRYPDKEIVAWAGRVAAWRAEGRDVFAYFDNDIEGAAPLDAEALRAQVLSGVRHSRSSLREAEGVDPGPHVAR